MKHLTAVAAVVPLLLAGSTIATDFTWTGGVSNAWHVKGNWSPSPAFPGKPALTFDRAIHNADTPHDLILFDADSGDAFCGCRMIMAFLQDAQSANVALTLQITGDMLGVDRFIMISDTAPGRAAKLDLDGGELHVKVLDITGTNNSPAVLDIAVDLMIGAGTVITGSVDINLAPGAVLDFGELTIRNGKIH